MVLLNAALMCHSQEYGDLRKVLKGCNVKSVALTGAEQMHIATQVCAGMEHLAGIRFLHMDLAARNCLVHHNSVVKVADFGLSRELPAGKDFWQSKEPMKLPVKWTALEALDARLFSEGSDVWAFGVLMCVASRCGCDVGLLIACGTTSHTGGRFLRTVSFRTRRSRTRRCRGACGTDCDWSVTRAARRSATP